jgi:hypothetical protein
MHKNIFVISMELSAHNEIFPEKFNTQPEPKELHLN